MAKRKKKMKEVARTRKRLLEDFVIPALDADKYIGKLFWTNKLKGKFRLYWSHKNAAKWACEDTIVFQDWDKLKGHYRPELPNYYMSAKQRFRAALYKLSSYVIQETTVVKFYRDYRLLTDEEREKINNTSAKTKMKNTKKPNQSVVRPSVIHKNTSYVAKSTPEVQRPKPPAPVFPIQEEACVIEQYSNSMEKINQLKISRHYQNLIPEVSQKYSKEVRETSVLRENSSTPRVPHIPSQIVPVYNSYKASHLSQNYPQILECPEVFVSKVYGFTPGPENVPESKDETENSMYDSYEETCSGVLNLSLKSGGSSPPSR